MNARHSPTVRRRWLATELRRLRKSARVTLEDAAKHLDLTHSTLSRVETGQATIRPPYVESLLRLYGVPESERELLVQLAREARQRGWWESYDTVLLEQYSAYIGFETEASSIRNYEPQTVPGLLQTEQYARALTRAQLPDVTAREVDDRVAVRLERQTHLKGADSARLWTVIAEPALHYMVGGSEVMREQLLRLLDVSSQPNVNIQVLPFSAGAHAGMAGPFVILGYENYPDVVYLENMTSSLYLEKEPQVEIYTRAYEHLRAVALSPEETRKMIAKAAEELPASA